MATNDRSLELKTVAIAEPGPVEGYCWQVVTPLGTPARDDATGGAGPILRLLEDGRELGPSEAALDEIIRHGGGRFAHSGRYLHFSTSDNSDPRTNGRCYEMVLRGSFAIHLGKLADQAAYAISIAENHLTLFRERKLDPGTRRVLEIGPGGNLGAQLLLADHCAEMIVADRFLTRWKEDHDQLYRLILDGYGRAAPRLKRALERRSVEGALTTIAEPAENLASLADASVDIVISNAVVEHLGELPLALRELRRVSRPGAWHFHQIDFRDHWSFTRPLEHLLLNRDEFHETRVKSRFDRGCQWRHGEVMAAIEAARLEVVDVTPNMFAEPGYFAEMLGRLRVSSSPYADWPEEDLRILGSFVVLRTPGLTPPPPEASASRPGAVPSAP